MAQPVLSKNPLGIPPFWQNFRGVTYWVGNLEPAIVPGIIAKDGNILQNLLEPQPPIRKPQETRYELLITEETNVQKSRKTSPMGEPMSTPRQPRTHRGRHAVGGSRHACSKLYLRLPRLCRPKACESILPQSKDTKHINEGVVGSPTNIVCRASKYNIWPFWSFYTKTGKNRNNRKISLWPYRTRGKKEF